MIRLVRTGAGVVGVAIAGLSLAACGGVGGASEVADDGPGVVVTTAVLGSLVEEVVDEAAAEVEIEVLMAPGVDPHTYAPSARDAQRIASADVVFANGLGLEVGLDDALTSAASSGVEVVRLATVVDPRPYGAGDHHAHDDAVADDEEHADDEQHQRTDEEQAQDGERGDRHDEEGDHLGEEGDHADEEAGHVDEEGEHVDEEGEHADEGALDPHVWLDPVRVATMAEVVAGTLAEAGTADAERLRAAGAAVAAAYRDLADELAGVLDAIPAERRAIVTNHDSLGYFADRFGLEVIATVLPGASTQSEPSAADVATLVELLEREQVRAVFTETTASDRVAAAIAADIGDVAVVELYSGSPGPPGSGAETVEGMLRANADRLADALR